MSKTPAKTPRSHPSTLIRTAQCDGSRPDLASVLQEGGQSANMCIRSGASGKSRLSSFTHEMKTLLAGLILIHSWYPNECCADKDCAGAGGRCGRSSAKVI